jgi:signal transduction histidine kinase
MDTSNTNENKAQAIKIHDIRNHLSSVSLALEQLRYEITEPTEDCEYYMDTINDSCKKINTLLSDL